MSEFSAIFDILKKDWVTMTKNDSPLDFAGFKQFVTAYTVGIEDSYPLKSENTFQFSPYIDLLHFSVAYNHFFYQKLCDQLQGNTIYPKGKYCNERHQLSDILILQLWRQKNNVLDNIARSFCIGREYQSFQQLRSYIEICQLLFLLLTDSKALTNYLDDDLSPDEYQKQWWKYFSPSKAEKRIANNKKNVLMEEKKKGMNWGDIRKSEPGGSYKHFSQMISRCNDYIHWKKDTLFFHSYDKSKSGFKLNAKEDWSPYSKSSLIDIVLIVVNSTTWIENALSCHVSIFKYQGNEQEERELMINHLHQFFAITSVANEVGYTELIGAE